MFSIPHSYIILFILLTANCELIKTYVGNIYDYFSLIEEMLYILALCLQSLLPNSYTPSVLHYVS